MSNNDRVQPLIDIYSNMNLCFKSSWPHFGFVICKIATRYQKIYRNNKTYFVRVWNPFNFASLISKSLKSTFWDISREVTSHTSHQFYVKESIKSARIFWDQSLSIIPKLLILLFHLWTSITLWRILKCNLDCQTNLMVRELSMLLKERNLRCISCLWNLLENSKSVAKIYTTSWNLISCATLILINIFKIHKISSGWKEIQWWASSAKNSSHREDSKIKRIYIDSIKFPFINVQNLHLL